MITADFHVHSAFSADGKAEMEAMVKKAIKTGLKTLCFTDHMDYDYPKIYGLAFEFDTEEYFKTIEMLKEKYRSQIEILAGVELGLQPQITDSMYTLINSYPFDFIIGSVHVVDGMDPYYPHYWEHITEKEGIHKCFKTIMECCKTYQGFHVCGHMDYIVRYAPGSKVNYKEYLYADYADIIDEILRTLLNNGKGIEINTSGYKYGLGHPHPKTEILKRYKELGGELITVGSDAHKPEHLCHEFGRAEALLKELGFRYYTIFRKGKPVMIKL
jgi:histidinol phosphate phosphatase HisJ family